ncbi:MAG: SemiSWEET transporter [Candidatus Omnitrophota bacterium]|jgi:MtN3 and saliva related transmembrane protein|nr:SemiSWEET transporter [Candidatus Omnitrophota bacterium]MDD5526719.1 SemiSWEET transporter [Candidatus Omnitrophota bacterium]HQP12296.1 SemiSWEET transporter [Candidatus Omnitrophota bacterium]
MFWNIIGLSAAFLTMFGFLPQVIKIYRTKSVNDISIVTIVQFMAGIFLWLVYGIHLRNFAIILANSVTLLILVAGLVLFIKYKFRKK